MKKQDNKEFEEFWKTAIIPCIRGTWQEVQFKQVAKAAFLAAKNEKN